MTKPSRRVSPPAAPAPAKKPAKGRRRPNIDIPLDSERDDTVLPPASSFFPRRSDDIRTPDQVLRGGPAPAPQPLSDEPAPPAAPAEPPAPKKPLSDKQKKAQLQQEVESAAQEVSDAIEQELAQGEETYRYPPITLLDENTDDNQHRDKEDRQYRQRIRRDDNTCNSGRNTQYSDDKRNPPIPEEISTPIRFP